MINTTFADFVARTRHQSLTALVAWSYDLLDEALADRSAIANTLTFLGQLAVEENAPSVARARFADALAIYRDRSDNTGIVWAAASLAESALADGEWDSARALAEESLAVSRDASIEQQVVALRCCGDAAFGECDVAAARRCFVEGLTLLGPSGRAGLTAQLRQAFARVAAARDQPDRALRLAGRAGDEAIPRFPDRADDPPFSLRRATLDPIRQRDAVAEAVDDISQILRKRNP